MTNMRNYYLLEAIGGLVAIGIAFFLGYLMAAMI